MSRKSSKVIPRPSVENTSQIRSLNGFSDNSFSFCTSLNDNLGLINQIEQCNDWGESVAQCLVTIR